MRLLCLGTEVPYGISTVDTPPRNYALMKKCSQPYLLSRDLCSQGAFGLGRHCVQLDSLPV